MAEDITYNELLEELTAGKLELVDPVHEVTTMVYGKRMGLSPGIAHKHLEALAAAGKLQWRWAKSASGARCKAYRKA
jgi:predicted ArsR family transcriptional regulator